MHFPFMENGPGLRGRDRSPFSTSHQYAPRLTGFLVGLLTGRLVVGAAAGAAAGLAAGLAPGLPAGLAPGRLRRACNLTAALLAAAFPAGVYGYLTPPTVGMAKPPLV